MIAALTLFGLLNTGAGNAAEVVVVRPWELHSSFWMSLHQRLISDAMRSTAQPLTGLSPKEQSAWTEAVSAYRTAGGRGNITFARPLVITTDALTQVADDAIAPVTDAPLNDALLSAAPIYREHWWTADDQANRFFIGYAAALLREASDELVRRHEAVYRTAWPARIRVYITPSAGPFGAYTINGRSGGVITTMSCRDEGYQGLRALEMLLHEGSHAIVGPTNGTVGAAITAAAKARNMEAPRDLWHAILFATSGGLTKRLLAERGHASFVPSSIEVLARVWPTYRGAIDKHWSAYLDGAGTLEEAIDKIVGEIAR